MTSEQRAIVRQIIAEGKRRGAPKAQIKAALETGAVESNFRNLNYGDADSKGWRQERQSLYKNPTNVTASIRRFYDEAKGMSGPSGEIAARVQRPAAQYRGRYAQKSRLAEDLLRGERIPNSPGRSVSTGTDDRRALLLTYLQNRHDPSALLTLARGIKSQPTTERIKEARPNRQTSNAAGRGDGIARKFGLRVTSGYRDPEHNAAVGGVPNSFHTRGTRKRPGANDFVGSPKDMERAKRWAQKQGFKEVLVHNVGSGTHLHVGY